MPDEIENPDTISREEFAKLFFEGVDEGYREWQAAQNATSARLPDWEAAIARAKREGVLPITPGTE